MKANDLRVTNLIENDRIVNAIIFIGYDSVELITPQGNNITARLELIKPVLLTKDWLLKLGAKKNQLPNGYWLSVANLKAELHFETFDNTDEIVTTLIGQTCELILDRIKYVHDLQNIYYSLTKTELSVARS